MRKTYLVLILTASCAFGSMAQNSWAPISSLPGTERWGAVSFSIAGKGYIGTGYNNASLNDMWEYDPATDSWSQKANLPGAARFSATCFVVGTKAYVGTGSDHPANGIYMQDFWEFDPAANLWIQKAGMPAGRMCAMGFSIGTKGYVTGGYNSAVLDDLWEYDAANDAWSQKTSPGITRFSGSAFVLGNKAYLVAGNLAGSTMKDVRVYDPLADSWMMITPFPGEARYRAVHFTIGQYAYVGLGDRTSMSNSLAQDFWRYDPSTDSWDSLGLFPGTARSLAAAFSIGSVGYVGTGWDLSASSHMWKYDETLGISEYQQQAPLIMQSSAEVIFSFKKIPEPGSALNIYSTDGKLVCVRIATEASASLSKHMFPKGIYIYSVTSGNEPVSSGKFVIAD